MNDNKLFFEVSPKEADYLLEVIEFFSENKSNLDKEALGEIMVMYWRIHRSKQETMNSNS